MKKLQFCVYVLFSFKDHKLYIGYTKDLKRRLTEHFNGNNTSTKSRRPFLLIFCEYYYSQQDAMRREEYLKTSQGKKGLKIMLKETFKELDYLAKQDDNLSFNQLSPANRVKDYEIE